VLTPPTKQTMDQRMKVSNLVAHHLQKLVESVDKMKPGRIKKLLTLNKQQKKEEKQDKIDQLMKTTVPLLVPTITLIDKKTREIQLPPTKFFPDGFEDKTYLIIDQPDGSKGKLWLWTELKNKKLVLVYNLVQYVTSLQDDHIITIKEGRIVDMEETKYLTDITNNEYHWWSPSELSVISETVSAGAVTSVKYLRLSCHQYSLADLDTAIKLVKTVTEEVWIDLSCIPAISSDKWAALANNVGDLKELVLYGGVVGGGAEAGVGRLVSRVSAVLLRDVKFVNFRCLADNIVESNRGEGARCQQIRFGYSTARDNKDKIVTLAKTLGWTMKNDGGDITISRKL